MAAEFCCDQTVTKSTRTTLPPLNQFCYLPDSGRHVTSPHQGLYSQRNGGGYDPGYEVAHVVVLFTPLKKPEKTFSD